LFICTRALEVGAFQLGKPCERAMQKTRRDFRPGCLHNSCEVALYDTIDVTKSNAWAMLKLLTVSARDRQAPP
jgi:hypothetical protein